MVRQMLFADFIPGRPASVPCTLHVGGGGHAGHEHEAPGPRLATRRAQVRGLRWPALVTGRDVWKGVVGRWPLVEPVVGVAVGWSSGSSSRFGACGVAVAVAVAAAVSLLLVQLRLQ